MPLGDHLVIKEELKLIANQLSKIILADSPQDERLIIAIGGESGSGKSEIAHVVSDDLFRSSLELKSFILHLDDFFVLPRKERNELRIKTNFESVGISEIKWDNVLNIIKRFKEGENSTPIPIYDLPTSLKHKLVVDFQNIPILLVDGLYANNIDANYSIFIDRTHHDTKEFRAERGKEVMDDFRLSVLKREHLAISKLKKRANIILNGDYSVTKL